MDVKDNEVIPKNKIFTMHILTQFYLIMPKNIYKILGQSTFGSTKIKKNFERQGNKKKSKMLLSYIFEHTQRVSWQN